LLENIKKSKGIIFLFILAIPLFTYLFMLLSSSYSNKIYFPSLVELSVPAIFGMYVIPFIMAVALFNFVFKKDSVDFINALPLRRITIYITNIIGGILLFLLIFSITSLFMWLSSSFFNNLVIPKMMYFHYFITFFIAYIYVFITSSLALTLTGIRIVHVALTLIILFLPGFLGDFYNSLTHVDDNYADDLYPTCYNYGINCDRYQINNDFILKDSYKLNNEQTIPYKYINPISRAALGTITTGEINYNDEISGVYNIPSIIKMFLLSIIYFVIGAYSFIRRKMELAETTFKSENIHQLVKCITLLPLSIVAIATFAKDASKIMLLIFMAVILIIYIVYDLITRRNNTHFMKSIIYFLGFSLVSILIYISFDFVSNFESSKKILKNDVFNIGIQPNASFDYYNNESDFNALNYKIYDNEIIDLIFNNTYKTIETDDQSRYFAIRLTLRNDKSYYFNMRLPKEEYNKLLNLLGSKKDYTNNFKHIDYDKIYGVRIANNCYTVDKSKKVIDFIRQSYEKKPLNDIINSTYIDYNSYSDGDTSLILYVYNEGVKYYRISSNINPDLKNYIMQMQNDEYVKEEGINKTKVLINTGFGSANIDSQIYFDYLKIDGDDEIIYKYINSNIKSDIDFSKYNSEEIIHFSVALGDSINDDYNDIKIYSVYLVKNENYQNMINYMKEEIEKHGIPSEVKGKI
jgi:hypothetical protein